MSQPPITKSDSVQLLSIFLINCSGSADAPTFKMLIQRRIRTGWNERCGIVDGASTLNQRTAKSSCLTDNNRYPSHKINLSVRGVDIAQNT